MIKGTDSLCLWCACSHLGESLELASALGSSCPSWGVCRVKVTIWASHAYWQWIGTVRLSLTESVRPLFQIILPLKFTLVSPVTIMHITASTPASDICIWSEPTPSLDFCYMWNVSGAKSENVRNRILYQDQQVWDKPILKVQWLICCCYQLVFNN